MHRFELDRILKAYRIGVHNNHYPIFDGTGAKLYPGRWDANFPVIYYCTCRK